MKNKITAIDIELQEVENSDIAYFRITKEMKEFLSLCNKKNDIIGFEFEDGSFNFGVILGKKQNNEK